MRLQILKQNRGASVLFVIVLFSIAIFIGQNFVLMSHFNNIKSLKYIQIREARISLLNTLEELLSNDMTLQNSRFNTNAALEQCLSGNPTPCDERVTYEMILYSPNPPVTYLGGAWPAPPVAIDRLAGGLTTNKVVFNAAGGRCDILGVFDLTEMCPLQVIVQFKPLCGGDLVLPNFSVPGGALCLGPANGIEIIAGIAILMNGQFVYHQQTDQDGDSVLFRFSANRFK